MEVDSKAHPFLSYVLSLRPLRHPLLFASKPSSLNNDSEVDLELANSSHGGGLLKDMPKLRNPELVAEMTAAVSDVIQTRSVLQALGERPDHEAVDYARRRIEEIERSFASRFDDIDMGAAPQGRDPQEWASIQKEKEDRDAAEKEKQAYKAVVTLYEMHVAYEELLSHAEERLVNIYRLAESGPETSQPVETSEKMGGTVTNNDDEVNEEVVKVLHEAAEKHIEEIDLCGQALKLFPEAFCKITTLISLKLANNKLEVSCHFLLKTRSMFAQLFSKENALICFCGIPVMLYVQSKAATF